MKMNLLFVFVCAYVFSSVSAIVDDCSLNNFNETGEFMQFTKETAVAEFVIMGNFKGLHCCAKGYRSVEWLKDGKLYPWPSSVSGLILYPESANQTIYTKAITAEDAGNYTCLIKNDTMVYAHTIELNVFDKTPDHPKLTYLSDDKEVTIGSSVRLFCEAFVGVVDLPDAHSEAIWRKSNHNGSFDDDPRIKQEKVSREDGQTFGTYLVIEDIQVEDFGKYICNVIKPGRSIDLPVYIKEKINVVYLSPNPIPWSRLLIIISFLILAIITIVCIYLRYGLKLQVIFKDNFGGLEEGDGKCSDVLIAYSQQDADIVLGLLLPTLESQYGYKCASKELPSNVSSWSSNLSDSMNKCRRLVLVLSPSVVNNKWDTPTVYKAIKQINSLNTHIIFITLNDLPKNTMEIKNLEGETLSSLLKTIRLIKWNKNSNTKFWLNLRLHLPSRRLVPTDLNLTQTNDSLRRLSPDDSPNNLDVFV